MAPSHGGAHDQPESRSSSRSGAWKRARLGPIEAFQANPKYLIDLTFDVPKLDLTGFRLEVRRLGQVIMPMDEAFEEIGEGMRYTVTMTLGSTVPILATVTRLVRTHFLAVRLDAWHRHNVEEVGNLPHFLPELYAAHATAAGSQVG